MTGQEMHDFMRELYPLCRSLTGRGTRETLRMIGDRIPLDVTSVPSGTDVLGWTVPNEWTPREAYIETPDGRRVADFSEHNLHLVGCSDPVDEWLSLDDLRPHLHSLPDKPKWIPYVTSYYKRSWGFCLTHNELESLPDGQYHAYIDATLQPGHLHYGECIIPGETGHLHYGECIIPGETDDTVLLSTYVCHPSMCNDNLSGPVVLTALAKWLSTIRRHYTYRIVFVPETIGCLAWLNDNRPNVVAGLVVTCCGDAADHHYKRSRCGDAMIDRIVGKLLDNHQLIDWYPTGSDERQYCTPGLNWPVGCLMRSIPGKFPEYHTSGDNCDFVKAGHLQGTLDLCKDVVQSLESNMAYQTTHPVGEHHLGEFCPSTLKERATIGWVLTLSDGKTTVLDIAERSGLSIATVSETAKRLAQQGFLV